MLPDHDCSALIDLEDLQRARAADAATLEAAGDQIDDDVNDEDSDDDDGDNGDDCE